MGFVVGATRPNYVGDFQKGDDPFKSGFRLGPVSLAK